MAELPEPTDWTPWGQPRLSPRGVETAFHHPLILVRGRPEEAPRVVAPGDVVPTDLAAFEWSPMAWALQGRRDGKHTGSPGPQTVFRGAGDRLFLSGDAACEQIFEGGLLGPRTLPAWTETLRRRIDECEARGIAYRHLVIPEAPAICAEAIPGAPVLSPDRPLIRILRAGGDKLRERLIYPLPALIAGRAVAETSLPHDVHLTGYGCFVCYRELMGALPQIDPSRLIGEADLRVRQVLIAGDLARSVGQPPRRVDFHEPPPVKHKATIKGASYKTNQVDVFENEDQSLPRLTMFRTSNSTHLFSYLIRHFSRIAAVATTQVHFDLIESERPDVVICEHPERYFAPSRPSASETDRGAPPHDSKDKFEQATGYKLPLP